MVNRIVDHIIDLKLSKKCNSIKNNVSLTLCIYKTKMSVCESVCQRISCQWLIYEQPQWHIGISRTIMVLKGKKDYKYSFTVSNFLAKHDAPYLSPGHKARHSRSLD